MARISKRRVADWWPVSPARARKLRKRGVLCKPHPILGLVRWNPLRPGEWRFGPRWRGDETREQLLARLKPRRS